MGKKIGGWVCDACRTFCDYGAKDKMKEWIEFTFEFGGGGDYVACSEACKQKALRELKDEYDADKCL